MARIKDIEIEIKKQMRANRCSYEEARQLVFDDMKVEKGEPLPWDLTKEEKANQKERISFPFEDVRRFFPKSYTQKDVYNAILKLIGEDYQRRERARKNRDER